MHAMTFEQRLESIADLCRDLGVTLTGTAAEVDSEGNMQVRHFDTRHRETALERRERRMKCRV